MFAQFRFDHYHTLFLLYLHKCPSCVNVVKKLKRVLQKTNIFVTFVLLLVNVPVPVNVPYFTGGTSTGECTIFWV